jgi:hypothetical protein
VADFKRKLKELEQPMGKLKAELQRVTASVSDAEKAHVSQRFRPRADWAENRDCRAKADAGTTNEAAKGAP